MPYFKVKEESGTKKLVDYSMPPVLDASEVGYDNSNVEAELDRINADLSDVSTNLSNKQDKATAVTHTASTAVGSTTQPVYIDANGTVKSTSYSVAKSVPSDVKFTDTTYSVVTTSANGLMSSSDKTKLNGIASGAQVNTITGVKGNSESSYRTGNVNLTPANIGAVAKTGDTMTGTLNVNGLKSTAGWFDLVYNNSTLANFFCNAGNNEVTLKATTSWLHLTTPSILALQTNDRVNITNVAGTAWMAVYALSYPGPSSRLIKENIVDMDDDDGLNVLKLRPIHFDYKKNFGGNKNQCGLIAEEVLEVIPEVVNVPDGYDEKNFDEEKGALGNDVLGIDYAKLTPHLIKLCQIQQKEIDELKERIDNIERKIG